MEEMKLEQKVQDDLVQANQEFAKAKGLESQQNTQYAGRAPAPGQTLNQNASTVNVVGSS